MRGEPKQKQTPLPAGPSARQRCQEPHLAAVPESSLGSGQREGRERYRPLGACPLLRVLSTGGFARAAGPGLVPGGSLGLGWHPLRLCSPGGYRQQDLFAQILEEWRRGGVRDVCFICTCCLWEQQSTTVVARQLHKKLCF